MRTLAGCEGRALKRGSLAQRPVWALCPVPIGRPVMGKLGGHYRHDLSGERWGHRRGLRCLLENFQVRAHGSCQVAPPRKAGSGRGSVGRKRHGGESIRAIEPLVRTTPSGRGRWPGCPID